MKMRNVLLTVLGIILLTGAEGLPQASTLNNLPMP
jgi:hypothetical protein